MDFLTSILAISPAQIEKWVPAAIGVIGALVAFLANWYSNRNKEKRFLTRDAITSLNATVNSQAEQIRMLQESDAQCKQELINIRSERNDLRDQVHQLQHEMLDLQKKTGLR